MLLINAIDTIINICIGLCTVVPIGTIHIYIYIYRFYRVYSML